jgi:hypothetical protein
MAKIVIETFSGEVPLHRASPYRLAPAQAQRALNCRLTAGELEPLRGHAFICTLPTVGTKSIYRHGSEWMSWAAVVNVVRGPIAEDQYNRVYWTGDGVPKVRGLVNSVMTTLPLGLPAPAAAPTVAVSAATTTTGEGEEETTTITTPGWSRQWLYWYEEPNGGWRKDEGHLDNEDDITLSADGTTFTLATIPPRSTASADAKFILAFRGYDSTGKYCGTMKASPSRERKQSSLVIDGKKITGEVTIEGTDAKLVIYSKAAADDESTTTISSATDPDPDNSDYNRDRVYVYTFVSMWGEEGPPSPPSVAVACTPLTHVRITGMSVAPTGVTNLTKKRIYRTVTDTTGTEYQFVAEVAIAATEYLDEISDIDTGEMIPSKHWNAPPAGLAFLVGVPGAFIAGAVGKTVYFSEQNMPHAWPPGYGVTLDYPVVALGVASGNAIIAITTGYPYVLTGDTPDAISVSRLPSNQSGVSARAIAYGLNTSYASPDGVVRTDGSTCPLITASLWTRREWQEDQPSEMIFATHDNRLYMFHADGGYILETLSDGYLLTRCDTGVRGFFEDLEQDILYFIGTDGKLYSWGGGEEDMPATWVSAEFIYPRPLSFSVARVLADAYPVTLKLYAAGALVHTREVGTDTVFNLPMLRPEKSWWIEIDTAYPVKHVALGRNLNDIALQT